MPSYSKNSNFYDFSHNFGNCLFLRHGSGKQEDCSALLQGKLPSKVFRRYRFSFHSVSVQLSCSVVSDSVTPWTAARRACLSITICGACSNSCLSSPVMPSNHLILCHPLLLLPLIFPSTRVFSNESVLCIRRPKCWSFSFSISLSNEYSGLVSFRMDLLDLLAIQGTLESLPQHHSSKASILQCSAFFILLFFNSLFFLIYLIFYF